MRVVAIGMVTVVMAAATAGCRPGGDDGSESDASASTAAVTYHRDIRPLFEANCVQCHHVGSVAPFALDSYDEARLHASQITLAVKDRVMPPGQADPTCRPSVPRHWLGADDRALFAEWAREGFPEGNPDDYVPPPPPPFSDEPDLGPPDIVIHMPQPYEFTTNGTTDVFEVVPLDYVFDQETYVIASRVVPDQVSLVHHAGILVVDSNDPNPLLTREELALAELGFVEAPSLGGYFPGHPLNWLPPGAAFVVPAASSLLLELHYHLDNWPTDSLPPADDSYVELWTLPDGEVPDTRADFLLAMNQNLDIKAGDAHSEQYIEVPMGQEPFSIVGITPHMHYTGVAAHMDIIHSDGSRDCVVDAPNYDFDWQMQHLFPSGYEVPVEPSDLAAITCTYDNGDNNHDLAYGTSSLDEMCIMYLLATKPF